MQITVYSAEKTREKWITAIIFMLLTLIQCMIINMFSSQTASVSSEASGGLVDWLLGIIKEFFDSSAERGILTHLVRKAAHFYNFSVLGILLCMNKELSLKGIRQTVLWCIAGLLVAVLDEFHQYFVPGRSAEIKDVMIDFSGVMFGMCFLEVLLMGIFKTEIRDEKRRYDTTKKS